MTRRNARSGQRFGAGDEASHCAAAARHRRRLAHSPRYPTNSLFPSEAFLLTMMVERLVVCFWLTSEQYDMR